MENFQANVIDGKRSIALRIVETNVSRELHETRMEKILIKNIIPINANGNTNEKIISKAETRKGKKLLNGQTKTTDQSGEKKSKKNI